MLEVGFGDFIIQEPYFFVVVADVLFKSVYLVVQMLKTTFPHQLRIFGVFISAILLR